MNSASEDRRDLNGRGKENSELSQNFEKKHSIKVRDVSVVVSGSTLLPGGQEHSGAVRAIRMARNCLAHSRSSQKPQVGDTDT